MPPNKQANKPREQSEFVKSFWKHRAATRYKRRKPEDSLKSLKDPLKKPIKVEAGPARAPAKPPAVAKAKPTTKPTTKPVAEAPVQQQEEMLPTIKTHTPSSFVNRFNAYNKRMKKELERFNKQLEGATPEEQEALFQQAQQVESGIIGGLGEEQAPVTPGPVPPQGQPIGGQMMEQWGLPPMLRYQMGQTAQAELGTEAVERFMESPYSELLFGPGTQQMMKAIPLGRFLMPKEREEFAELPTGTPEDVPILRWLGYLGPGGREKFEREQFGVGKGRKPTKTSVLAHEARLAGEWAAFPGAMRGTKMLIKAQAPKLWTFLNTQRAIPGTNTKIYKGLVKEIERLRGKLVTSDTPEAKQAVQDLTTLLANFAKKPRPGKVVGPGKVIGEKPPVEKPIVRVVEKGGRLVEEPKPGVAKTALEKLAEEKKAPPPKIEIVEPIKRPVEPVVKRTGRGVGEPLPTERRGFGVPPTTGKAKLVKPVTKLRKRAEPPVIKTPEGGKTRAPVAGEVPQFPKGRKVIIDPYGKAHPGAKPVEGWPKVEIIERKRPPGWKPPKPKKGASELEWERMVAEREAWEINKAAGTLKTGKGVTLEFGGLSRTGKLLKMDLARMTKKARGIAGRIGLNYEGVEGKNNLHKFSLPKQKDIKFYAKSDDISGNTIVEGVMETLKTNNIPVDEAFSEAALRNIAARAGAKYQHMWPKDLPGLGGRHSFQSPYTGGDLTPKMYEFTPRNIKKMMLENYKKNRESEVEYGQKLVDKIWPEGEKFIKGPPVTEKGVAISRVSSKKAPLSEQAVDIFDDMTKAQVQAQKMIQQIEANTKLSPAQQAAQINKVTDKWKAITKEQGRRLDQKVKEAYAAGEDIGFPLPTSGTKKLSLMSKGERIELAKEIGPAKPEGTTLDIMGVSTTYKKLRETLKGVGKKVKLPKYARSINLEKQDIPQEMKAFQKEVGELAPKKYQSWDTTDELSKEILSDYEKIYKVAAKAKRGQALNTKEINALRQINVNAVSRLKEIAETGTPEQFAKSYESYANSLFKATSDASSEIGRALNIHKKDVSVNRMASAFRKLERSLNKRELDEFKKLNMENPFEVKQFIDRLGDPKLMDYFYEYWYNSILSGPPTHLVNIISNTGWGAFQIPHRALTGGIDSIYSMLTGQPRSVYAREIVPMMGGYLTGFGKGRAGAAEMLRTGRIQQFETKWVRDMGHNVIGAFERSPHASLRKLAPYVSTPTRALRAMDVWANSIAYDAQLRALAMRSGLKQGLKGDDLLLHQWELLENPSETMLKQASEFAKYSTFMDDPGKITQWMIAGRNKIPLSRLVVPFVNTLANLTKRGIEMTPGVGLTLAKGQRPAEVLAKQIEGTMLSFYILQKADAGEITGPAPKNEAERDAFYRQGKLPWSIRIGDTWYQYRRIEPFNTVIASAAIAYESLKNAKDDATAADIFGDFADGMVENLLDSTFLSGVTNILDRYGRRKGMVQRMAASTVPLSGFWRSIIRAYEVGTEGKTLLRDTKSFIGALSQNVPGMQEMVPPRIDVWGDPIEIPGGVGRQWLPYKFKAETKDPVERGLMKLNEDLQAAGEDTLFLGMPEKEIRGVELTDPQYQDYVKIKGDAAKKRMRAIITGPNWARLKPVNRRRIMSKVWSAAGREAKAKMLAKYRLLIQKREQEKMK